MALDFLGSIGGLSNAASGIAGIIQAIQGPKKQDKLYQQALKLAMDQTPTAAEQRANSLYEAALDPNNSLVKSIANANSATGMEAFLSSLKQMADLDRRGQLRGRQPVFSDPSRRDEMVDYHLSRGLPFIQAQANKDARTSINDTATNIRGLANPQIARQNYSRDAQLTDLTRRIQQPSGNQFTNILSSIQGLIGNFGGGGNSAGGRSNYSDGTYIDWNQPYQMRY